MGYQRQLLGSRVRAAEASASKEARAILIFGAAEMLDVATTLMGLRSGRFREGNPAAGNLLAHTDLLMALKLVIVMGVLLVVQRFISPRRRAGALTVMATIAMAAPMLNAAHLVAGR
jgi:hypothetical protein